ncbi:MAG: hypothetical protein IIZ99_03090 [Turicibacter sp.]|nr:hypothetical protein [Turicibacter sp.]
MGGAYVGSGSSSSTVAMSSYAPTFYRSFSGTDALVFIILPQTEPILLGSLSTISYSMYRDKKPVSVIGKVNVGGFTRGTRIYAGTMIFTLLNQHWVNEVKENVGWLNLINRLKTDELPLFDLMIVCANEYGAAMQMFIYGVDLTEEGQVLSIEDLFIENTFNFVARDVSNFSHIFQTQTGSQSIQPYLTLSTYRMTTKSRGELMASGSQVSFSKEELGLMTKEEVKEIQCQLSNVLNKEVRETGEVNEELLTYIKEFQLQQELIPTGLIDDKVRRRLKELTENAQEDKIQRYSSVENDRIKNVEIESSFLSEDYEPGAYQVSVRSSYHFSLIGCQIESSETLTCQIFVQVRFKDKVKNHYLTHTVDRFGTISLSNYLYLLSDKDGETPTQLSFIIYKEPEILYKWNLNLVE